MDSRRLLIIDDEENMCHVLKVMLERHGYEVATETSAERALALVERNDFAFILCDVRMPGMDGLSFVRRVGDRLHDCPVIMMSAYGSVDNAIEAMKAGAYDFISKPFKTDEVLLALKKAEERETLRKENRLLKEELKEIRYPCRFINMVGESAAMQEIFRLVKSVAQYNTTVLITGKSGTGKELVARGIHHYSARKNRPFVAVNCGSIPENLLESELFGHVRGAFTGADLTKKGLFDEADGSTLFLDEIGELPLLMQVKLLRVLQEREFRPVGCSTSRRVDVRILAATARNLEERVGEGLFRQDLYYRLNVLHIPIPSLETRRDDIPFLCQHFIKKFNNRFGMQVDGIAPEALKLLFRYHWPGNVRELENVVQRGMVLTNTRWIETQHLPDEVLATAAPGRDGDGAMGTLSLKVAQKDLEMALIRRAMALCTGNKSKAAKALEISYPSLLSKLKEYGLP